jgi:hypothetical protein
MEDLSAASFRIVNYLQYAKILSNGELRFYPKPSLRALQTVGFRQIVEKPSVMFVVYTWTDSPA